MFELGEQGNLYELAATTWTSPSKAAGAFGSAADATRKSLPELLRELIFDRAVFYTIRCRLSPRCFGTVLQKITTQLCSVVCDAISLGTFDEASALHKDLQALTVLLPLRGAGSFEGGGTAFWPRSPKEDGSLRRLGAVGHDLDGMPPALSLAPPAGTALLFGGDVTHAGQPVSAGERAVFVASFSRRAPAGAAIALDVGEEELQGLERAMLQRLYGVG